jgi:hypothetical protein
MQKNLKWVKFAGAKALFDEDTEEIYVKRCVECNKLLTPDEASYGHDCE